MRSHLDLLRQRSPALYQQFVRIRSALEARFRKDWQRIASLRAVLSLLAAGAARGVAQKVLAPALSGLSRRVLNAGAQAALRNAVQAAWKALRAGVVGPRPAIGRVTPPPPADTLVERTSLAPSTSTIPVEIVPMSLGSTAPITLSDQAMRTLEQGARPQGISQPPAVRAALETAMSATRGATSTVPPTGRKDKGLRIDPFWMSTRQPVKNVEVRGWDPAKRPKAGAAPTPSPASATGVGDTPAALPPPESIPPKITSSSEAALRSQIADLDQRMQTADAALRAQIEAQKKALRARFEASKVTGLSSGLGGLLFSKKKGGSTTTNPTNAKSPWAVCAYLITVGTGSEAADVDHSAISINGTVYSFEGDGMVTYPNVGAYLNKRKFQDGRQVWVNKIPNANKAAMLAEATRIIAAKVPYHVTTNNCALNACALMKAGGAEVLCEPKPLRLRNRNESQGVLEEGVEITTQQLE